MSETAYLLDTSAWLTLLEDEPGAERVEIILRSEKTLLPWTVLMEVHYITCRQHDETEADRRYAYIRQSPASILWELDEPILLTAAQFKARHRISLADALIAAYASSRQAVLVHKDPEYDQLSGEIRLEALPYK